MCDPRATPLAFSLDGEHQPFLLRRDNTNIPRILTKSGRARRALCKFVGAMFKFYKNRSKFILSMIHSQGQIRKSIAPLERSGHKQGLKLTLVLWPVVSGFCCRVSEIFYPLAQLACKILKPNL